MSFNALEQRDPGNSRWLKLMACVVAMLAIANLQYAWTLFTDSLTESLHASLHQVEIGFSLFIIAQTILVPITGYLVDRFGPRLLVSIAGVFVGASWIWAGVAHSLGELYAANVLGGIGAGVVYGSTIGIALKWFPDRRGLCAGVVAGAFGFGTALTFLPIQWMIESSGHRPALLVFGIIQGAVVIAASPFMTMPPVNWLPAGWESAKAKINARVPQSSRNYTPREMIKTGTFYVLYSMMTLVAFSGLMFAVQLKPIAKTYGLDVAIVAGGLSALSLAGLLDRLMNGLARPFFGWISDHIGRYETMALAFTMEGLAIAALSLFVDKPIWFVLLTGLIFFAWGDIYSLFPSAIADIYGPKYATTNYGIQYTSKGVASILAGPGAALIKDMSDSWLPVMWIMAACNFLAAIMAIFWMKPMVKSLVTSGVTTPLDSHPESPDSRQEPVSDPAVDGISVPAPVTDQSMS